jgi:hypothetical protein
MSVIHNVAQNSTEWYRLRTGIPTASQFKRIVTPGGKLSEQADSYMCELLAEYICGYPFDSYQSEFMERGALMEKEAVKAYEFQTDRDTQIVGFITSDDGMIGASPDRLVGEDRLLEIKSHPQAHGKHVSYMLGRLEKEYQPQLQGQLWITGREAVDVVSYHAQMPSVIIPVARNEQYISTLSEAVESFVEILLAKRDELDQRYGPFTRPNLTSKQPDASEFDVTADDVDLIWANLQLPREGGLLMR